MAGVSTSDRQMFGAHLALPPLSILRFNPFRNPPPVSPPIKERSLAYPFSINAEIYNNALNVIWPITIAIAYAATVAYVNRINVRRQHKPWAFSRTSIFFLLVVTHNILLSLYSAWTFTGMVNAIRHSWPGLRNEYGTAGVLDSLCKLHGPRGLGSAATYSPATGSWSIPDLSMRLIGGVPDSTDVGRLFNQGLAYYGWLFYLSKFYEVVDTAIILAKGKKSSFLQTYHHTGAMFAMWAGIRFMSPPIWMFTCINSFIHTWMYAYYAASSCGVRVPGWFKRCLTSAQIFQIIFGASYAFGHLFVAYDMPTYAPFRILNNLSTALPTTGNLVSSAVSSATVHGDLGGILKKVALRAAGQEGLAANVRNAHGEAFGLEAVWATEAEKLQERIVYKVVSTRTHCLDTSGEVFAIVLNLFYLVPLAYLFISFFAKYFEQGTKSAEKPASTGQNARISADKAATDLSSQISEALNHRQGGPTQAPPDLRVKAEETKDNAESRLSDLAQQAQTASRNISGKVQSDLETLKAQARKAGSDAKGKASKPTQNNANEASKTGEASGDKTKGGANGDGTGAAAKNEDAGPGDPGAYEAKVDEVMDKQDKKAEQQMQPNGV